ncbi:MAG: hypothetical protein R3C11_22565 [Planctomycetaceae bacterium]
MRKSNTIYENEVNHPPPGTSNLHNLTDPLRLLVERELREGEHITWIGQPLPWKFGKLYIGLTLFGIPWTAFALFWMAGAAQFEIPDFQRKDDFFFLFGLPFVLIGFFMLTAPYWSMRKAKQTVYVMTTKRVILIEKSLYVTISSFSPERLKSLRREEYPDGSGNLIFEQTITYNSDSDRITTDKGFFALPDIKEVEDRVRELVDEHDQYEAERNRG